MTAGDKFAVMLVPKGRVSDVVGNSSIGGAQRPLFSLATANPDDEFHLGQIADLTGDGNTFVFEDQRFEISDYDYNDVIFQIRGAVGDATYVGDVVDSDLDWRGDDMGKALLAYSDPYFTPTEQQDLTELAGLDGDEGDVGGDVPDDGGDSETDVETDVDPDEAEVSDEADEVSEDEEAATDESDDESDESDDEADESDVAQAGQSDNSTTDSDTSDSASTSSPETSSNESDSSLDDSTELTTDVDETQDSETTDVDETQDSEGTDPETTDEVEASQEDLSGSDEDIEEEFSSSSPVAEPKPLETPTRFEFTKEDQPLVGVIDTGFAENNSDLDYDNISLGKDLVDGDDNPLLAEGEGNEHGTHILGIIAAEQDNGEGIDGINPDAPIWLGRGVGSGEWADSLVEFVDAAKESGQPNAVVNLSMDLTQTDAEGNVTTRYELTPMERAAIEYARQNNVMIVAAAGNDGGVMSALGQASQEFDNIMTVGAAEQFDPDTSAWQGSDRTNYSSYGQGLDVVAYGGTTENPQLSLTGEGTSGMAGTSVATAKVTGAVSQVWAANPELSYRQVVDIIRDTATDLGDTGNDAETGAGLLNLTAAVHLAKVTKPQEHSTPAILSPETWSGEGVFTPGERAVQNVIVPPEWRRWYYGWLNDSNPSDTFAFSIDEPTPLQFSLNVPAGSAVLRKNGRVVLEGKYDGNMLYAGADGKLDPGNYVLTVNRGNLSRIDEYKLVMNFVEGSSGKETPFIDYLPGPKPAQPPAENPPVTDISEWIKKLAEKRAKEAILKAYEAQKGKLGNALEDIQFHWKAFNGVNVPAVQYFDGGYIVWNGVSAIPYFTGTGHKLPNLDLPETVAPIWQPTPKANRINVPDGRHTYPNMRGTSEYRVNLKGSKNDINLAVRDTVLAHPDLRTTVYRDFGGGRLRQVPLTDINPDDNYANYQDLPAGKYLIKVDVEQSKANSPYRMIVNLDQAGGSSSKARNLNREYGKIDGKRIIISDHVGLPTGDKDLYAFTTSDFQPTFAFAVRSLYSDLNEVTKKRLLDGDIKMRLLDAKGDEVLSVDSKNRRPTFAAKKLEPNSKYYVEVKAKNGSRTNYDLVLNFEQLWAPHGRHEFDGLTGQLEYKFRVDSDATDRTLHTAVRDARGKTIDSRHYTSTVYRKQNGQWVAVNPNSTGNSVLLYSSLRPGEYRVVMTPKSWMPSSKNYTFVHNLDQAGQSRSKARNLGNIGGKRVTRNDHVGIPTGDLDYYKFSTGSDPRLLHFAVRHPSGSGRLEGDFEFVLYDKNGKQLKKVNSKNRQSIHETYDLDANSEYYVRVKAQSGHAGNYHLVLNAEVKRTVKPDPTPPNDGGSTWQHPLPGYPVTSEFGVRNKSWDKDKWHNGIDLGTSGTTPSIKAAKGGKVVYAGWNNQGYGKLIILDHGDGTRSYYAHLSDIDVSYGQTVSGGSHIGNVGNTGYSLGNHLHFEIRVSPYGYGLPNSKNPRDYIQF
jgi:murein DD-endopeptidase MepM/ murein hydrolase activator NlpD